MTRDFELPDWDDEWAMLLWLRRELDGELDAAAQTTMSEQAIANLKKHAACTVVSSPIERSLIDAYEKDRDPFLAHLASGTASRAFLAYAAKLLRKRPKGRPKKKREQRLREIEDDVWIAAANARIIQRIWKECYGKCAQYRSARSVPDRAYWLAARLQLGHTDPGFLARPGRLDRGPEEHETEAHDLATKIAKYLKRGPSDGRRVDT
jgi:hypothetical protein